MQNEHIVVTHTTQRTPLYEVRKKLKEVLSPEKYSRVILLMDKRRQQDV
jgi:hypothetical protein